MGKLTIKNERNCFIVVTAVSFLIRLIRINMPILEGTVVRQVQTASIARFFFNHGVDIFYSRLDHMAGEKGYLILEFPLYNVILSGLYNMAGGVHEYLGRLLSISFFIGAGIFLYLLLKKVYDSRVALCGFIAFNFSPLGIIFSRTIMPDSEMLFFSTGAIFFMLLYFESDRKKAFWLSSLCTMLSLLVKVQSFFILLPLLFLVVLKQKKKMFLDVKNYVFGAIALVPAFLWYSYGAKIHQSLSPERIANYSMSNWFNPGLFLSADFYKDIFTNFTGVLLTPVGFILFLLGILIIPKKKTEFLFYVWLLGTGLFGIVFCSLLWEPYYYLLFLPIAAAFIGRVFMVNWSEIYENSFLSTLSGKVVTAFIIIIIIARYAAVAYVVPEGYRFIPEAADVIKEFSSGEELIVVGSEWGTGAVLYYSGREGYALHSPHSESEQDLIEFAGEIEIFREKGGRYFFGVDKGPFSFEVVDPYLREKYKLIKHEKGDHYIYSLK